METNVFNLELKYCNFWEPSVDPMANQYVVGTQFLPVYDESFFRNFFGTTLTDWNRIFGSL